MPDPHFEHQLLTSGVAEPYCPAGHDVQAVAPVDVNRLATVNDGVILPAGQFWQVTLLVASVTVEKVPDRRQNAIINNDRAQRCGGVVVVVVKKSRGCPEREGCMGWKVSTSGASLAAVAVRGHERI